MYFDEFKALCDEANWNTDHILVQIELGQAKEYAYKMVRAKKWLEKLDGEVSEGVVEQMDHWIRIQDENRMRHMLNALDMAELSTGLGDNWDDYLKEQWEKSGLKIPKL